MFESIITGASILGLLMIGGLVAEYVNVTTPLVITTGVGEYAIQDIFDSIIKGLLPLLTLGGVYAFINKVSKNYVVAILLLFIIGIVLGGLGIIA
jgi:PTS system mannose-specific IID component